MKLADMIKMMVQEEADEMQLQEEIEIEKQLAEIKEQDDQEEGDSDEEDSILSAAEIREQRALERRRSKAHHRATLSTTKTKSSMFDHGGKKDIQAQKRREFLDQKKKRKSAVGTAIDVHALK